MKALVIATLALVAAYGTVSRAAEDKIPHVEIVRRLDHGTTEGLKLKCTPDLKGTQEFFCELNRYRNGVEVRTMGVYSKQMKEILKSFFQILPETKPGQVSAATKSEVGKAPAHVTYTWNVAYAGQAVEGILTADKTTESREVMRAVLSLEGALSSQFYR